MRKKIEKIANAILIGIIALIVVLILFSKAPIPGNYQILIVKSGSMEPSIHTGSLVVVKPADNYNVGDVVTFSNRGQDSITHRIVEINNDEYTTKGDANDSEDSRVVRERDVIGKVGFSIPWAGYIVAASKEPIGFIFLVIVPALYLIVSESINIYKEVKSRKSHG